MTPDIEALYDLFKVKAEAVAADVYRSKNIQQAGALLVKLVAECDANKVAAAASPMVNACLKHASLKVPTYTENLRQHAAEATLGLSELDMAVADIGSLQQDCTDVDKRLVSMLPNVHIALVKTSSLVPDLKTAFAKLQAQPMPGYLAFITGPSRTADIERILTIGVHGPAQVKIIFVDDPGGGNNE